MTEETENEETEAPEEREPMTKERFAKLTADEVAALTPEQIAELQASMVNKSPDVAAMAFKKCTRSGKDAHSKGPLIKRHSVEFQMDGASCAPDVYVNDEGEYFDFMVTMRSLSPQEEDNVMAGVKIATAGTVPLKLVLASLYAINGEPIKKNQKDVIWASFGQGGRQICQMQFARIGSASEAALGKSLSASSMA